MPLSTINALASRLASTDPLDSKANSEILAALRQIRSRVQELNNIIVLEGLDGAILMLNFHVSTGGMGGPELVAVLQRIVSYVQLCALQHGEAVSTKGAVQLGNLRETDPVSVVGDMQLGQILLGMGYISEDDINACLAHGRDQAIPFGEALLENNVVGEDQVREALSYQAACRRAALAREGGPVETPMHARSDGQRVIKMKNPAAGDEGLGLKLMTDVMLGEILMRNGAITLEQLDSALLCQRATGVRLGEALVDAGACGWHQVESALECQAKMRRCG